MEVTCCSRNDKFKSLSGVSVVPSRRCHICRSRLMRTNVNTSLSTRSVRQFGVPVLWDGTSRRSEHHREHNFRHQPPAVASKTSLREHRAQREQQGDGNQPKLFQWSHPWTFPHSLEVAVNFLQLQQKAVAPLETRRSSNACNTCRRASVSEFPRACTVCRLKVAFRKDRAGPARAASGRRDRLFVVPQRRARFRQPAMRHRTQGIYRPAGARIIRDRDPNPSAACTNSLNRLNRSAKSDSCVANFWSVANSEFVSRRSARTASIHRGLSACFLRDKFR